MKQIQRELLAITSWPVEHVGEELADQRDRLLVGLARAPLAVGEVVEARARQTSLVISTMNVEPVASNG